MIRVLVVDDQQILRRGLRMLLGTVEDLEVVGEAGDGREALAMIEKVRPDVVVSDARMPGMSGIELVEAATQRHPGLPVIILTTFDEEPLVRDAVAAGVCGFLLKDVSTDTLAEAIRAVSDGGLVIDPRMARAAMSPGPAAGHDAEPDALAVLTRAERAVAVLVADGATNTEIAERLVLAEGTVKNHVSALLRKVGARDRTALALTLYRALNPS